MATIFGAVPLGRPYWFLEPPWEARAAGSAPGPHLFVRRGCGEEAIAVEEGLVRFRSQLELVLQTLRHLRGTGG